MANPYERQGMYTVPQEAAADFNKTPTAPPYAYGVQVVPMLKFSQQPIQCTCGNCRSVVITRVEESTGLLAWLLCVLLLIVGCGLGCCLIPFCVSSCQNFQHYCPNCNAFIGEYRPL